MKHLFLGSAVVLLAACGDGKKEAAEKLAAMNDSIAAAQASRSIDLSAYDTPLLVDLGDPATLGVDSGTVKWNEEFGQLEVSAGERFALAITEEPADLARLKADLDRDMLRKHTILEETPDRLVYRSQFPDEDLVFIHFLRIVQVGDRTFVVRDAEQGRFNEADVVRMVGAVRPQEAS